MHMTGSWIVAFLFGMEDEMMTRVDRRRGKVAQEPIIERSMSAVAGITAPKFSDSYLTDFWVLQQRVLFRRPAEKLRRQASRGI